MADSKMVMTVAVLGGTGKEGGGLAARWARNGYRVVIGSRSPERAAQKAAELNETIGDNVVLGAGNLEAATQADLVVLSVPYGAHKSTLETVRQALTGKILIDVTVPLQPPDVRTVHLPDGQSAAMEAQTLLGDAVQVVAAFQNVGAAHLADAEHAIECDVLVCGDDRAAKTEVIKLVEAAGLRGIDAGKLQNAIAIESLTPVLISINIRYKVPGAGIRITGLDL